MDKYAPQKRHLSAKKQLRVWVDAEKYDRFKKAAEAQNNSIYSLINKYIDDYIAEFESNN